MALVLALLLCNAVQVGAAMSSQQDVVGHLKAHSIQRDDASAVVDKYQQQNCYEMVDTSSFWQRTFNPWNEKGYETKTTCIEVPQLKNTATPGNCQMLHIFVLVSLVFVATCGVTLVMAVGPKVLVVLVIPMIVSWWYAIQTGLWSDYWAGAIVWTAHSLSPSKFHNISPQCIGFMNLTYIWTVFSIIYGSLISCFLLPNLLMARMTVERRATSVLLSPEDREAIQSQEFRTKCVKAFREADADHNGTLDMSELQHVVLFDLTDEEKKYVQESAVFKEAFEKCDADKSNSIDQEEFVEVMKFIMTKAKYGASQTSASATEATEP